MNLQYKIKKLEEVSVIVNSGVNEFKGNRKYVSTGDVKENRIISHRDVTYNNRPSRANMEVKINDIICAKMKYTNKVILINEDLKKFIYSTGFTVIRPNKNVITPNFLYQYLKSDIFQAEKNKLSVGSTQIAINNKDLKSTSIPVPIINTQKTMFKYFNYIDNILYGKYNSIKLLNNLKYSFLYEFFGDPLLNPKKWRLENLDNLCSVIYRYPTFYGFKYINKGIPVVRIGNINEDGYCDENLNNYVKVDIKIHKKYPKTTLEHNDILMAVRGDGSTGKMGIVSSKNLVGANISPNLIRIKPNPSLISSYYLFYLLSSNRGQEYINKIITRTAKKKLTATEFKEIKIPAPILHLQNKFDSIIIKVDNIITNNKTSIKKIKNIYASKTYKYYKHIMDHLENKYRR